MRPAQSIAHLPTQPAGREVLERDASQSDQQVLAQVVAGRSDLFAELVRRYQRALVRVARGRLGRDDWAEEVVQETFLAAFKSCRSYDERYGFRTWLWTILLNQCRAHYQRRARGPHVEPWSAAADAGIPADGSATPLELLLAKEQTARIEALLTQLSAAQAEALRLRFYGGLKFHEIAQVMDCSLNTAKNQVRWGLLRMADLVRAAATADPRAAGPSAPGEAP